MTANTPSSQRRLTELKEAALSPERLRELLSYDPLTGDFRWLVGSGGRVLAGSLAGHINRYRLIAIDGRRWYRAHRLAWLYVHGTWPVASIDHINGQPCDNRLANLRDVTNTVNNQNRRRAQTNSASGFLGVSAVGKRWKARIKIQGKQTYIGVYPSPELAYAAYVAAKRIHHPGGLL